MNLALLPALWQALLRGMARFLDPRCGFRLGCVLLGLLFAQGRRRTVTTWLRAAQVQHDFPAFYYFLGTLGRAARGPASCLLEQLLRQLPHDGSLRFVIDDTPTQRYGPQVQGAGTHHHPSPGPADAPYLYGHVWVTLAVIVVHPTWGPVGLPVQTLLYVRQKDVSRIPWQQDWRFRTKLELAADLLSWAAPLAKAVHPDVQVVVDGAYAKKPFLKVARQAGVTVISRLRRDAALRHLPRPRPTGRPGRPALYGRQAIDLALRAGQRRGWQTVVVPQYGEDCVKRIKTFEATWRPAGGRIRVVLVQEGQGWLAWFSTDPTLSAEAILQGAAQRMVIEQNFHDLKEVEGMGQPQLRDIWGNVGAVQATLWEFTLVEWWAWQQPREALGDRRESPWDDPERRPSHADKRKALQRWCLTQQYEQLVEQQPLAPEIHGLIQLLLERAT